MILDTDIAQIYVVSTKRLKEQVKRNFERFPNNFMFQLTREELDILRSQFATLEKPPERFIYLPYAFTRNGANMLSAVIRSPIAIQRSIQIMRAFSAIEEAMRSKKETLVYSPKIIEQLSTHSRAIMHLFQDNKVKTIRILKIQEIQKK